MKKFFEIAGPLVLICYGFHSLAGDEILNNASGESNFKIERKVKLDVYGYHFDESRDDSYTKQDKTTLSASGSATFKARNKVKEDLNYGIDLKLGASSTDNKYKGEFITLKQLRAAVETSKNETFLGWDNSLMGKFDLGINEFSAGRGGVDNRTFFSSKDTGIFDLDKDGTDFNEGGHKASIGLPRSPEELGFFSKNYISQPFRSQTLSMKNASDVRRITTFTKSKNGFKFAFSWAPENSTLSHVETIENKSGKYNDLTGNQNDEFSSKYAKVENISEFGILYNNNAPVHNFAASLTYQYAGYTRDDRSTITNQILNDKEDFNIATIGLAYEYSGLFVAGSYSYWGRSGYSEFLKSAPNTDFLDPTSTELVEASDKLDDAYFATLGLGASFGPYKASLGYFKSSYQSNEIDTASFSLTSDIHTDKRAKLSNYLEISYLKDRPDNSLVEAYNANAIDTELETRKDTEYWMIMMGVRVNIK